MTGLKDDRACPFNPLIAFSRYCAISFPYDYSSNFSEPFDFNLTRPGQRLRGTKARGQLNEPFPRSLARKFPSISREHLSRELIIAGDLMRTRASMVANIERHVN